MCFGAGSTWKQGLQEQPGYCEVSLFGHSRDVAADGDDEA